MVTTFIATIFREDFSRFVPIFTDENKKFLRAFLADTRNKSNKADRDRVNIEGHHKLLWGKIVIDGIKIFICGKSSSPSAGDISLAFPGKPSAIL